MLKSKFFYIVLIALIIGIVVVFKNYHQTSGKTEVGYLMQTIQPTSITPKKENPLKLYGTLTVTSGVLSSQEMANAILCVQNANLVEKVDLYMPDMGHGSEPPKVTSISIPKPQEKVAKTIPNFGCFTVESMQLFMPGLWQVRVFYKDSASGIFSIDLKK